MILNYLILILFLTNVLVSILTFIFSNINTFCRNYLVISFFKQVFRLFKAYIFNSICFVEQFSVSQNIFYVSAHIENHLENL